MPDPDVCAAAVWTLCRDLNLYLKRGEPGIEAAEQVFSNIKTLTECDVDVGSTYFEIEDAIKDGSPESIREAFREVKDDLDSMLLLE